MREQSFFVYIYFEGELLFDRRTKEQILYSKIG